MSSKGYKKIFRFVKASRVFHTIFSTILLLSLSSLMLYGCFGGAKQHKSSYRIVRGNFWNDSTLNTVEKRIQGFSDDLLFTIGQLYKLRIQIQTINSSVSLNMLDNKDVDAIVSAMNPTPQILRDYQFSHPFFVEGPVIVCRYGENFTNLESLKDRVIGVSRVYLWSLDLINGSQSIYQPYDDTSALIEALLNSQVDAIIINSIVASQMSKGLYLNKIHVTSTPLKVRGLRLVVKKGTNDELVADFNEGLKVLIEKGTYSRMLKYWELFNAQDPMLLEHF
jgi:ABC-type amino acid transport substrate-binding protein